MMIMTTTIKNEKRSPRKENETNISSEPFFLKRKTMAREQSSGRLEIDRERVLETVASRRRDGFVLPGFDVRFSERGESKSRKIWTVYIIHG